MSEAVRRRGWGLARVSGRSMEPTLREGDLLLVRWSAARAAPGRLAVLRLPERGVSVKRLHSRRDGGWWAERDNPAEGVDSWLVGAIPERDVLGVVMLRLGLPRGLSRAGRGTRRDPQDPGVA